MNQPIHIKTISELHHFAGGDPPDHPLMSIMRVEDIPELPSGFPSEFTFSFYTIGLKKNLQGYVEYGRKRYDFQQGVMGFTAPNQVMSFDSSSTVGATGWMLFFHPDLLHGHQLGSNILEFGFFDYEIHEALHLSPKEEDTILQVFENIHHEYHQPIDLYSKSVVLSNLELLLTYCNRFYGRQFVTRHDADQTFLSRFEKAIKIYFRDTHDMDKGIPTVNFFADQLNVSPSYLSDSLKALTGKTTQDHIHYYLLDKAKNILIGSDKSVSEVAYELGFDYPQYFSRLFKEKVGMTPKEYRLSSN